MTARRALVTLTLTLVACSARPSKDAATPGSNPTVLESTAVKTPSNELASTPTSAPTGSASTFDAAVTKFLLAANTDADADAERLSTSECWTGDCASFARQAGQKFQARATGTPRSNEHRAVVPVDVMCPGERKCDFVYLLLEVAAGQWRVAGVTEADTKAAAWLP